MILLAGVDALIRDEIRARRRDEHMRRCALRHYLQRHTSVVWITSKGVRPSAIFKVAVSPDGQWIITDDARVRSAATGVKVGGLVGHDSSIVAIAVTADSQFAVTGSLDMTARVWSLPRGVCKHVLRGHTAAVMAVASTPAFIITGSWDKTV